MELLSLGDFPRRPRGELPSCHTNPIRGNPCKASRLSPKEQKEDRRMTSADVIGPGRGVGAPRRRKVAISALAQGARANKPALWNMTSPETSRARLGMRVLCSLRRVLQQVSPHRSRASSVSTEWRRPDRLDGAVGFLIGAGACASFLRGPHYAAIQHSQNSIPRGTGSEIGSGSGTLPPRSIEETATDQQLR